MRLGVSHKMDLEDKLSQLSITRKIGTFCTRPYLQRKFSTPEYMPPEKQSIKSGKENLQAFFNPG
jgi:hypothetical protein